MRQLFFKYFRKCKTKCGSIPEVNDCLKQPDICEQTYFSGQMVFLEGGKKIIAAYLLSDHGLTQVKFFQILPFCKFSLVQFPQSTRFRRSLNLCSSTFWTSGKYNFLCFEPFLHLYGHLFICKYNINQLGR